jgi:hypothetical protein
VGLEPMGVGYRVQGGCTVNTDYRNRDIIIVDVDGVLAPHQEPGEDAGICHRQVSRLIDAIFATGCSIVLSSAWRYMGHGEHSVYAQCLYSAHAMGEYVVKHTICALPLEPPGQPIPRDELIRAWVAEHQPRAWVAIDDLECIEKLPPGHWVRVDGKVGLTTADANRVIELIQRQRRQ